MGNHLCTQLHSSVHNYLPEGDCRKQALAIIAGVSAVYLGVKWFNKYQHRRGLYAAISRRLAERECSLAMAEQSAAKVDEVKRAKIAAWDFQTLREQLQNGSVSCIDVVRVYQWKALRAHEKTNCATQFVKEAEEWALRWDTLARQEGFEKPPFFGIPISVKECIPMAGYDVSRGYAQDLFKPIKTDCVLIEQLKNMGCIPFVLTNVPQSLLSYNSCNPIYGTTHHVMDTARTTGGSSGGESAILSADGSVLGIGSDVGGSIRIPCHFTGMAGIKASSVRFSHRGIAGAIPGRPLINANEGPMAKDIRTNVDFLREVWKDTWIHSQDAYVPPVVWNEELYKEGRKYKIGYYVDDGWFTPTPAIQRSVLEAKALLEAAGHTLVPFKPPRIPELMRLFIGAICVDGGKFLLDKLGQDIVDPTLKAQMAIYSIPIWLQRLLSYPAALVSKRLAHVMTAMTNNTSELRQVYAKIEGYRTEFTEMMRTQGIDALLCPPQVMTAPPHMVPSKLFAATNYTCVFNLLDYAAGVVNVTKVTSADDAKLVAEYPETDGWYRLAKNACKDSVGLPVGVQVAAPPFREEIVLRILRDVEIAVTGK